MNKIEEFLGIKYKLHKEEHFDDLLAFLKTGYIERKLAHAIRPVQYLTKNKAGTYTLHFVCPLLKYRFDFKPGVEFCEMNPALKAQALINFEGNKMIHIQKDESSDRTLKHVYEFYDDKLTVTTTAKGLECIVKRYYLPMN